MKVVINRCYGGFGLSKEAKEMYVKLTKIKSMPYDHDLSRDDLHVVKVVETLGSRANGPYAALKVVSMPNGVDWQIDEYDGMERIREVSREWS